MLHLLQGLAARKIEARLLAPRSSELFRAASSLRLDVQPLGLPPGGFDLVHAHDARAHTLACFTRLPLIVSRRVAFAPRRSVLSRWKYQLPVTYLAVSEYVKRVLVEAGIRPLSIDVVPDGVRLPENPARLSERTTAIAMDSQDPGKCRDMIERAAKLAEIPIHFSNRLLRDLPFAGLFLYISQGEGLGSAALLAMAHQVPVIASRVGGLPEIVKDGDTGLLTENVPEAIASTIRHLNDNPALASRLAFNGRRMVERHYTVDHMVDRTVEVYRRVLG